MVWCQGKVDKDDDLLPRVSGDEKRCGSIVTTINFMATAVPDLQFKCEEACRETSAPNRGRKSSVQAATSWAETALAQDSSSGKDRVEQSSNNFHSHRKPTSVASRCLPSREVSKKSTDGAVFSRWCGSNEFHLLYKPSVTRQDTRVCCCVEALSSWDQDDDDHT